MLGRWRRRAREQSLETKAVLTILITFSGSAVAAAALSSIAGPVNLLRFFFSTVYGVVLVGKTATMYMAVRMLTENELASLFAGILYNNALAVTTLYAFPQILHLLHTRKLPSPRWMRINLKWSFYQTLAKGMAVFFISMVGFTLYLTVATLGFYLFMPVEVCYALVTAATVYRASELDAENLPIQYGKMLRKSVPATATLLTASALLEAYEITSALLSL